MKELHAKGDTCEQGLEKHIEILTAVSMELARSMGVSPKFLPVIKTAAQVCQIGMAADVYQKYGDDCEKHPDNPCHWEISWAFLTSKYGFAGANEQIFRSVYWTHAKETDQRYVDESEKTRKTRQQINNIVKDYSPLEDLLSKLDAQALREANPLPNNIDTPDLFVNILEDDYTPIHSKLLYNKMVNSEVLLIRSILISAERYTIRLTKSEFSQSVDDIIKNLQKEIRLITPCDLPEKLPDSIDPYRYEKQLECAKEALSNKTTIARAPAGLGKTLIGILWAVLLRKSIVWICPRNMVAEAVFKVVVKNLKMFGFKLSVQLFYNSSIQEQYNHNGDPEPFSSDITITNIDAVLNPIIHNNHAHRLERIANSALIFDEFHELVQSSPLFALFIIYMKARVCLCSEEAKTLLLSATPTSVHTLWDTEDRQTKLLPDNKRHYPAIHRKLYNIKIQTSPGYIPKSTLVISNSVVKSQIICNNEKNGTDRIIHSKFTVNDKKEITSKIYYDFGEENKTICKDSVSSATILTNAWDVSFPNVMISVNTPEITIQPVGRCNRWGRQDTADVTLICYNSDDKNEGDVSEFAAMRIFYKDELRALWIKHLKENIKGAINLDTLYEIYNSFYEKYSNEHLCFYKERYKKSLDQLVKFIVRTYGSSVNKVAGKTLRNFNGSYFFTVRKTDENGKETSEWISPDDVMTEGGEYFDQKFRVDDIIHLNNNYKKIAKALVRCGYDEKKISGLGRRKNGVNLGAYQWKKRASSPLTPIPDLSRGYHPLLGLIKLPFSL